MGGNRRQAARKAGRSHGRVGGEGSAARERWARERPHSPVVRLIQHRRGKPPAPTAAPDNASAATAAAAAPAVAATVAAARGVDWLDGRWVAHLQHASDSRRRQATAGDEGQQCATVNFPQGVAFGLRSARWQLLGASTSNDHARRIGSSTCMRTKLSRLCAREGAAVHRWGGKCFLFLKT